MKKLYSVCVLSKTLVKIVPPVLILTLFTSIKSTEAGPQTAVYVRFLSPPHGYSHGLEVHYPGANPVAKEERLYLPPANQQNHHQNYHNYQQQNHQHHHHTNEQTQANHHHHHEHQQKQQYDSGAQVDYHYPRPDRVFHELGERFLSSYPQGRAMPELLFPVGLFQGPSSAADFQREHPGAKFDPLLLTGSLAQRIVSMVMTHGILYFHEIPHEPLVLGNNLERIQNNLIPHRLGSIRPGHPFFNFNK